MWPVVLSTLPGGEHWICLLFFDLFLLGINSAFAILEGPLTVLSDWVCLEKTIDFTSTSSCSSLASPKHSAVAGCLILMSRLHLWAQR